MDNVDLKGPATVDESHLQSQIDSLHHLLVSILVLLVVISGTLSIFLLRQWRMTSKDLASVRPGAAQIIADYNKDRSPRMDTFLEKLKDYGRTHPDFVPILVRYNLVSNTVPAAPRPSAPKK